MCERQLHFCKGRSASASYSFVASSKYLIAARRSVLLTSAIGIQEEVSELVEIHFIGRNLIVSTHNLIGD